MARGVLTGEKLEKELERLSAMTEFERQYAAAGILCGIDEAGRGPLAGPVAAGAVILPKDCRILYLNDSKKLSEKRREELFLEIKEKAVSWSVGLATPERIDEINILQATYEAMRAAVAGLSVVPDLLLNDAVTIPGLPMKQVPIIKGDAKSVSIAAASILAKVTRDTKNNILAYSATTVCGVDNIFVIVNKFNLRLPFCDSQRRFTLREYSQHQFTMILILTI